MQTVTPIKIPPVLFCIAWQCLAWPHAARADDTSAAQSGLECPSGDADGDGICDAIENRTGTDPLNADTDGDGVPDHLEDHNLDGRLDKGETDPRVPGLFPGTSPYIPEPLHFDLVRALGARRGELEVNTLIMARRREGRFVADWAPEIEWAFADGASVEFELPMQGRQLVSYKVAAQLSFAEEWDMAAHGSQIIVEHAATGRAAELTGLYLLGVRMGRWSLFSMTGLRTGFERFSPNAWDVIFNPSLFADIEERLTVGLETNGTISLDGHGTRWLFLPQAHWQVSHQVRVQAGIGVEVGDGVRPTAGGRLIFE
jgi:hypothetical protein